MKLEVVTGPHHEQTGTQGFRILNLPIIFEKVPIQNGRKWSKLPGMTGPSYKGPASTILWTSSSSSVQKLCMNTPKLLLNSEGFGFFSIWTYVIAKNLCTNMPKLAAEFSRVCGLFSFSILKNILPNPWTCSQNTDCNMPINSVSAHQNCTEVLNMIKAICANLSFPQVNFFFFFLSACFSN